MLFIHHKICTSSIFDYGDINVPLIRALKKQREIEEIKEPNTEAPTIDLKDVSKTYEYLIQYLRGMQGGSGVPISYVLRESNELHPKPSVDDPFIAYATHGKDMFKRSKIIAAVNLLGTEEDGPLYYSFVTDRGRYGILYPHLSPKQRPGHTSNALGQAVTRERQCWHSIITFWEPTTSTTFRIK